MVLWCVVGSPMCGGVYLRRVLNDVLDRRCVVSLYLDSLWNSHEVCMVAYLVSTLSWRRHNSRGSPRGALEDVDEAVQGFSTGTGGGLAGQFDGVKSSNFFGEERLPQWNKEQSEVLLTQYDT